MGEVLGEGDDGVTIEEVQDEEYGSLEPETPEVIATTFNYVTEILSVYGWFILFGAVGLCFLWKMLQPKLKQWENQAVDARHAKDPDLLRSRLEGMDVARRRLQEKHDQEAAEFIEKQRQKEKEKEEAKRQERIDQWEKHVQGQGYYSKQRTVEDQAPVKTKIVKKDPALREDFNPLMGNDSSRFRAASRDCGTSGG